MLFTQNLSKILQGYYRLGFIWKIIFVKAIIRQVFLKCFYLREIIWLAADSEVTFRKSVYFKRKITCYQNPLSKIKFSVTYLWIYWVWDYERLLNIFLNNAATKSLAWRSNFISVFVEIYSISSRIICWFDNPNILQAFRIPYFTISLAKVVVVTNKLFYC